MKEYFDKYGKSIESVCLDFGPVPAFTSNEKGYQKVVEEMHKRIPVEKLPERRKWRDERLIALSQLKKRMDQ